MAWNSIAVTETAGFIRKWFGTGGFVVVPGAPHEFHVKRPVLGRDGKDYMWIIITAPSQPVAEGRLPEVTEARLV